MTKKTEPNNTTRLHLDMQTLTERRAVLGWIGATGTSVLMAGCKTGGATDSSDAGSTGGTSNGLCVVDPTETNGPYPSDGSNRANGSTSNVLTQTGVIRQDLRTSFGAYTGTASGVKLQLTITIVDVNDGCSPLEGYVVYLWHCNALGQYSIYDIPSENYLRGIGISDSNGEVIFTTIIPGCYPGRFPHTHFEIFESETMATHYNNRLLVSQMVIPEVVCENVYNNASGYGQSASSFSRVSISSDNVFADNSSDEIAMQTPELSGNITDGYVGTVKVGISI